MWVIVIRCWDGIDVESEGEREKREEDEEEDCVMEVGKFVEMGWGVVNCGDGGKVCWRCEVWVIGLVVFWVVVVGDVVGNEDVVKWFCVDGYFFF